MSKKDLFIPFIIIAFGITSFFTINYRVFSQNFSSRFNVTFPSNLTSNQTFLSFGKREEQILEEINKAYQQRNYERVALLAKRLSPLTSLRPEENLILAESFLLTGHFREAQQYAQRVISVKRGTLEACRAELIKHKVLILIGKGESVKSELKTFLDSYCDENQKKEAKVLLYHLKSIDQKDLSEISPTLILKVIRELHKAQISGLLNQGKTEEARSKVFYYINVYGTPEEASELILKLAESYFSKGERERAKTLYELIITLWDQGKPGLISKFRLYQITYERTTLKELLPQKTKEDLLSFIAQVKARFPGEPIAEEATFLEIQVLKEIKNYRLARKSALEFIKNFSESSRLPKVRELYCEVMTELFKEGVDKQDFTTVLVLEGEDREFLKQTSCGEPYYVLGNSYLVYNFMREATLNFIKAFELGVKKETRPFLLLKSSFVALETEEYRVFDLLFRQLLSEKPLPSDPLYWYLRAFFEGKEELERVEKYLPRVLESNLAPELKKNLLHFLFKQALIKQRFSKALNYMKNPNFNSSDKDFALILLETLGKNKSVFEEALILAKKAYPNDSTLSLIEAYYLEREGKLKSAENLWKKLTETHTHQGELARIYEKTKQLVEKAQDLVY